VLPIPPLPDPLAAIWGLPTSKGRGREGMEERKESHTFWLRHIEGD